MDSNKTARAAGRANAITQTLTAGSIVPFTGGTIIFLYAFFWPESYGHWLGVIVRSFRQAAGL